MKTKISFFFLVMLTISTITAQMGIGQTTTKLGDRLILGVSGGLSIPTGNLSKTGYSDAASGFAGPGYNTSVQATWLFTKHLGLSAAAGYRQFSYRGIQNISDGFQDSFDVDSASATSKGSNHTVSLLIGPHYSVPLCKRLYFEVDYLLGLTYSTLAGWDVVLTDAGITHPPLTQNPTSKAAFGYEAAASIRYKLTQELSVGLKCLYFHSRPDFAVTNEDRLANAGRILSSYDQPFSGLDVNLGFCWNLKI